MQSPWSIGQGALLMTLPNFDNSISKINGVYLTAGSVV